MTKSALRWSLVVAYLVVLLATTGCIDRAWLAEAKERYEVKYHLKKDEVKTGTGQAEVKNNKVHPPFRDRECDKCHIPDKGSELRGTGAEFCYLCHKREEFQRERLHGPVAAGDCSTCHSSHESPFPNHTTLSLPNLCFKCHEAEWWEKNAVKSGFSVHKPVAQGKCPDCHDPHGGKERYFVKGVKAELCLKCHDAKTYGEGAVHGPLATGDCLFCHQPHASRTARLLRIPGTVELCRQCHTEPLVKCGPDAEKQGCLTCHDPHRAESQRATGVN